MSCFFSPVRRCGAPLALLTLFVVACNSAQAPAPFPLYINVNTETGTPVAAAAVAIGGITAGSTNESGELQLRSSAVEGSVLTLSVTCPRGFKSPAATASLAVRRLTTLDGSGTSALRHRLICNPTEHTSVLVVSTAEPNLPILVNGAAKAFTSSAGIAHVLLRGTPETAFDVKVDTQARPELRPQSPTRSFILGKSDELVRFEQPIKAVKVSKRRAPNEKPAGAPYRME